MHIGGLFTRNIGGSPLCTVVGIGALRAGHWDAQWGRPGVSVSVPVAKIKAERRESRGMAMKCEQTYVASIEFEYTAMVRSVLIGSVKWRDLHFAMEKYIPSQIKLVGMRNHWGREFNI
jgi:hypothetical protein